MSSRIIGPSLYGLAVHAKMERRLAAAEALYEHAIHAGDRADLAAFELGIVKLARGDIAGAWPWYERRRGRAHLLRQNLTVPEWRGEDLTGKRILVWREQGLGDQILAARFLPLLAPGAVTYAGPPHLERLFAQLGVDYMLADNSARLAGFDHWVMPLSIPAILGLGADSLPKPPYLSAAPRRTEARIGVMTSGNPLNPNDRLRSLPQALTEDLLSLPGAISLAPETTGAADMLETAEIIAGLDLVITVDTSVAHLAGALGAPTWVLLGRHRLDWTWPDEGRSIWYPELELFIQPEPGDWRAVVDRVKAKVAARRA